MLLLFVIISLLGVGLNVAAQNGKTNFTVGSTKPLTNEAVATFAEGCFWQAKIFFQSLEVARNVVSGYAGKTDIYPSYEKVAGAIRAIQKRYKCITIH